MTFDRERDRPVVTAAVEAVPEEPAAISRKVMRRRDDSVAQGTTPPPMAWSFGDVINAGLVMRRADAGEVDAQAHEHVAAATNSSGTALPGVLRRKFESSLGVDLSGVRVHTGEASERATGSVSALAYALGSDIHFNAGQYDPSSAAGEHLLAHEVAHTVQQSGSLARAQYKLEVSGAGDACEVEADAAADAMIAGRSFAIGGGGSTEIARQPGPPGNAVQAVTAATPAQPGMEVHGDHAPHAVAQGLEVAHTAIEITELVTHVSFGIGIAGFAMGAVGTVVGTAAQLHAGHEFTQALGRAQPYTREFCNAYAHAVRGEPAGESAAAHAGASAGQRARTAVLARGITAAQLATLSVGTLYGIAFNAIRQPMIDRLVGMQRSGLFGTHFMESNAVPNAPAIAAAAIDEMR